MIERGKNYLTNSGIHTVNGCLNHLRDSSGKEYRIPNFCINEPFMEKALHELDENRDFHKIKVCSIIIEDYSF